MKNLFDNYRLPAEKKEPSNIHTQYQDEGVRCCDALGIKDNQERGRIINIFKRQPRRAAAAFSFVADATNVKNPLALFLWKFKQLKPAQKNDILTVNDEEAQKTGKD